MIILLNSKSNDVLFALINHYENFNTGEKFIKDDCDGDLDVVADINFQINC